MRGIKRSLENNRGKEMKGREMKERSHFRKLVIMGVLVASLVPLGEARGGDVSEEEQEVLSLVLVPWKLRWKNMTVQERRKVFSLFGGGLEKWIDEGEVDFSDGTFSPQAEKELSKLVHGFFLRWMVPLSKEDAQNIWASQGDLMMKVYKRIEETL